MAVSLAKWAAIRLAYEAGVADDLLAERVGVTLAALRLRAAKEAWQAGPHAGAATTLRRLARAIEVKLEHMEKRMAGGKNRSAADEEREIRAIGTMIRNFEKVTEVAAGIERGRSGGKRGAGRLDAERIRREIADRLDRLSRARLARSRSREARD